MTLAKRLLLGTAAAFVATSGAQAADLGLPVAPSVDYVQICSIGSFTGFILPGSDVCFDISGYARGQLTWSEEIDPVNFFTGIAVDTGIFGDDPLTAVDTTDVSLLPGFVSTAGTAGTVPMSIGGVEILPEIDDGDDAAAVLAAINLALSGLTDAQIAALTASGGFNGDVVELSAIVSEFLVDATGGGTLADLSAASQASVGLTVLEDGLGFVAGNTIGGLGALLNTLGEDVGDNDELAFDGEARVEFDARTMTEYGLLRGFIRLGGENGTAANVDHAYVQLNVGSLGFTAGRAASAFDPEFTGYGAHGPGLMVGDTANEQFSVNANVGNGVTVSFSVEAERDDAFVTVAYDENVAADAADDTYFFDTADTDGGQSIPDFIAAIRVDQAWGSAKLAGVLTEVNPEGSNFDSEYGYALSGSAEFNIPVGVGSTFGVTGIYSHGANSYLGFDNIVGNSLTGDADAVLITSTSEADVVSRSVELTTAYVIAAGFNFGLSEMVALSIDGAYADIDHEGELFDGNTYIVRAGLAYVPVNNLRLDLGVTYQASDFNTSDIRSDVDDDEWSARFRVTRSF